MADITDTTDTEISAANAICGSRSITPEPELANRTDTTPRHERALQELRAAIRRHPELANTDGYPLAVLVDGLLKGIALVGSYEDLLAPLQQAMAAVGWMDPLVRGRVQALVGHQRYQPLGDPRGNTRVSANHS